MTGGPSGGVKEMEDALPGPSARWKGPTDRMGQALSPGNRIWELRSRGRTAKGKSRPK